MPRSFVNIRAKSVKSTYHRNGVAGRGFTVATFDADYHTRQRETFLAITLRDPAEDRQEDHGHTFVLRLRDLAALFTGELDLTAVERWHGDDFEAELIPILAEHYQNQRRNA